MTVLGIDTSYYTASVAVVEGGRAIYDGRRPLAVSRGERGVSPAKAVFSHVKELPALLEEALAGGRPHLIAASVRPRPDPDSYLPPFRVGAGFARAVAAVLGVPLVATSHQEMHLACGLWTTGLTAERFLAVHLSGGTTELLLVKRSHHWQIESLGESADISAGQFLDRIGVALGLPFPAGPHLDALAQGGRVGAVKIPSSPAISFAGPETAARRFLGRADPADIALAAQLCVANGLEKWLRAAVARTGVCDILLVGGVARSPIIRERLMHRLPLRLHFCHPHYCTDNAVGVALVAEPQGG